MAKAADSRGRSALEAEEQAARRAEQLLVVIEALERRCTVVERLVSESGGVVARATVAGAASAAAAPSSAYAAEPTRSGRASSPATSRATRSPRGGPAFVDTLRRETEALAGQISAELRTLRAHHADAEKSAREVAELRRMLDAEREARTLVEDALAEATQELALLREERLQLRRELHELRSRTGAGGRGSVSNGWSDESAASAARARVEEVAAAELRALRESSSPQRGHISSPPSSMPPPARAPAPALAHRAADATQASRAPADADGDGHLHELRREMGELRLRLSHTELARAELAAELRAREGAGSAGANLALRSVTKLERLGARSVWG